MNTTATIDNSEEAAIEEVTGHRPEPIVVHRPRRDTDAVLREIDFVLSAGPSGVVA